MKLWRVAHHPTKGHRHRTPLGFGHPLLVPVVASYFQELRIPAGFSDGSYWWKIHSEPGVSEFELEHSRETERQKYNARMLERVQETKRAIVGEHAGYADLFVPVIARDQLVGLLVTGPFAKSRATSAEVLERWRWLTGHQSDPQDPEFQSYLSATLATLVLDRKNLGLFQNLVNCLAELMSGEGDAGRIANRAEELHLALEGVRSEEVTWDSAQSMMDDRFPRSWSSAFRVWNLRVLGLSRPPEQVVVALTRNLRRGSDAVDEAVRRDAFQRAAVELGRKQGEVVAGRVGDRGVVFLSNLSGSASTKRQKSLDFAELASSLGRRFGLSLCFGAHLAPSGGRLSRKYQAALGAAEQALIQDKKWVVVESSAQHLGRSLQELRRKLAEGLEERPSEVRARFERYLEAVAAQAGYRVDAARGHLEAGFERIAERLIDSGALDEKSFAELHEGLSRAASEARTMTELAEAYRLAIADLSGTLENPSGARQDRSLRRAVDYIREHYAEPLSVKAVARVAGFTPSYFSKLFIKRERMPFVAYVAGLRLERAKQLLSSTELDVVRIAKLCGFSSHTYFCRVFKRTLGTTPHAYRRSLQPKRERKSLSRNS